MRAGNADHRDGDPARRNCVLAILSVLLIVTGCSEEAAESEIGCDDPAGQQIVLSILKDQVSGSVVPSDDDTISIAGSRITGAVRNLQLTIDDVRTTLAETTSSKRFCTGTLLISVPVQNVDDADYVLNSAGEGSVSGLAEKGGLSVSSRTAFAIQINFNVQPTDDQTKIYAELEDAGGSVEFLANVLRASLLRPVLDRARAATEQFAAEQSARSEAAERVRRAAQYEYAREENKLAMQTVNQMWSDLEASTRSRLLPAQRAWVKQKDAECRSESMASAVDDGQELRVAALECDTRFQNERAEWLSKHLPQPGPDAGTELQESGNFD